MIHRLHPSAKKNTAQKHLSVPDLEERIYDLFASHPP